MEVELDSVVACADLVARAGGRQFDIGYLDDDPARPRWYAQAYFKGARLICDEKRGPAEAADCLARKVLNGGQCTGCKKTVTLHRRGFGCFWWRDGAAWVRGCDGKRQATRDAMEAG